MAKSFFLFDLPMAIIEMENMQQTDATEVESLSTAGRSYYFVF